MTLINDINVWGDLNKLYNNVLTNTDRPFNLFQFYTFWKADVV